MCAQWQYLPISDILCAFFCFEIQHQSGQKRDLAWNSTSVRPKEGRILEFNFNFNQAEFNFSQNERTYRRKKVGD